MVSIPCIKGETDDKDIKEKGDKKKILLIHNVNKDIGIKLKGP